MRGIINQIEEEWVIVEITNDTIQILLDETKKRRQEIEALMDELWED